MRVHLVMQQYYLQGVCCAVDYPKAFIHFSVLCGGTLLLSRLTSVRQHEQRGSAAAAAVLYILYVRVDTHNKQHHHQPQPAFFYTILDRYRHRRETGYHFSIHVVIYYA